MTRADQTGQALRALAETTRREQRPASLGDLEITVTPPAPPTVDTARRYADLGVSRLIIELEGIDDTEVDSLITSAGDFLTRSV